MAKKATATETKKVATIKSSDESSGENLICALDWSTVTLTFGYKGSIGVAVCSSKHANVIKEPKLRVGFIRKAT